MHQAVTLDFTLSVGSTTAEITVNAAPPVIDTQTGTLTNTITGAQAEEMPVVAGIRQGIGVYPFMMYNPGVGVNDSGNFFANGTRQVDTYFSSDGIVDMQDVDGIGGAPSSMNLSNVSEMTTVTAGANAEYRSPTNFILASKSGGNRFHGSLYYDWNGDHLVCANPANIGRFGNAAPYQFAGPPTRNLDFTLMKDFRLAENRKLQFQAVFANILNHPAFANPAADINATSTVGAITSTAGNYLQGSSPQRVINFVLRFQF